MINLFYYIFMTVYLWFYCTFCDVFRLCSYATHRKLRMYNTPTSAHCVSHDVCCVATAETAQEMTRFVCVCVCVCVWCGGWGGGLEVRSCRKWSSCPFRRGGGGRRVPRPNQRGYAISSTPRRSFTKEPYTPSFSSRYQCRGFSRQFGAKHIRFFGGSL